MTNAIATVDEFQAQISDKLGGRALFGSEEEFEQFCLIARRAVAEDPKLLNCEPASLFRTFEQCALDRLRPDGREAAIVIRGGRACYEPMVFGIIKMLRRSGDVLSIRAKVVYGGDFFEHEEGTERRIAHRPDPSASRDESNQIAVYAIANLKNGETELTVLYRDDVKLIEERNGGPVWKQWPRQMWEKTAIRALAKLLPVESETLGAVMHEPSFQIQELASAPAKDAIASAAPAEGRSTPLSQQAAARRPARDDAWAKSYVDKLMISLSGLAYTPTKEQAEDTPDPITRVTNGIEVPQVSECLDEIERRFPARFSEFMDRYSGLLKEISDSLETLQQGEAGIRQLTGQEEVGDSAPDEERAA